jgi:hypothetical protein
MPEKLIAHCNRCFADRKHDVLHVETERWEEPLEDDERYTIWGGDKYEMIRLLRLWSYSMKAPKLVLGRNRRSRAAAAERNLLPTSGFTSAARVE